MGRDGDDGTDLCDAFGRHFGGGFLLEGLKRMLLCLSFDMLERV